MALDLGSEQVLRLADCAEHDSPACELLTTLPPSNLANGAMLVRFHHDLDAKILAAHPLTVVTDSAIIRMTL